MPDNSDRDNSARKRGQVGPYAKKTRTVLLFYNDTRKWGITSKMVLSPPRKLSVVSRNRRTMEWRKTLWLACKVQIERISCLLPSMQLWLQSGTRWAEWHYQTFCHWKHRTQPMLPATECQTTRTETTRLVSEDKSARMLRQLGPYYCFIILFNIYMCII
jgi:hypothetical protein